MLCKMVRTRKAVCSCERREERPKETETDRQTEGKAEKNRVGGRGGEKGTLPDGFGSCVTFCTSYSVTFLCALFVS